MPETLIVLVTACEPFGLGQPDGGGVGLVLGVGEGDLVGVLVGVGEAGGWEPVGWSDHCLVDTESQEFCCTS
ncbi:hypothetical protein, partial [Microbispora sp. CSR-4]|uniref:hypothetical protein n=1 Tax=Microbispora sp. CSR-4 TaxID=2592813 RepID=UPI0021C57CB5